MVGASPTKEGHTSIVSDALEHAVARHEKRGHGVHRRFRTAGWYAWLASTQDTIRLNACGQNGFERSLRTWPPPASTRLRRPPAEARTLLPPANPNPKAAQTLLADLAVSESHATHTISQLNPNPNHIPGQNPKPKAPPKPSCHRTPEPPKAAQSQTLFAGLMHSVTCWQPRMTVLSAWIIHGVEDEDRPACAEHSRENK
jgi:hypothetical protein